LKNRNLIFALVANAIFIVACDKNNDEPIAPQDVETLNSVLPKQAIFTDETVAPASRTQVYSVKYDTANHKIELYVDDTTNTNPYDILAMAYTYNSSGYLTGRKIWDHGNLITTTTIERDTDNKINWIASKDYEVDVKDTVFFSYQAVSGNLRLVTIVNTYYAAMNVQVDNYVYNYDAGFKIKDVQKNGSDEKLLCEYNTNNSIKKMNFEGYGGTNETNFYYTSGIADGKDDIVQKVFLGKDYYLQNIKDLYCFNSFVESRYYSVSATDPFHLSKMQDIYDDGYQIITDERSWSYELNSRQLLSRLTASTNAQQESTVKFKY